MQETIIGTIESEDYILPSLDKCKILARMNRVAREGKPYVSERDIRWDDAGGDYCIYCLCEQGNHVRYIGITNQKPSCRLAQHISDCGRGKNAYKENWLRKCENEGIPVTINIVRAGLTASRAGMMEVELIRFFKKSFRLTNTHTGGATGYAGLSEESKQKHRKSMREIFGEPIEKVFLPARTEIKKSTWINRVVHKKSQEKDDLEFDAIRNGRSNTIKKNDHEYRDAEMNF